MLYSSIQEVLEAIAAIPNGWPLITQLAKDKVPSIAKTDDQPSPWIVALPFEQTSSLSTTSRPFRLIAYILRRSALSEDDQLWLFLCYTRNTILRHFEIRFSIFTSYAIQVTLRCFLFKLINLSIIYDRLCHKRESYSRKPCLPTPHSRVATWAITLFTKNEKDKKVH